MVDYGVWDLVEEEKRRREDEEDVGRYADGTMKYIKYGVRRDKRRWSRVNGGHRAINGNNINDTRTMFCSKRSWKCAQPCGKCRMDELLSEMSDTLAKKTRDRLLSGESVNDIISVP